MRRTTFGSILILTASTWGCTPVAPSIDKKLLSSEGPSTQILRSGNPETTADTPEVLELDVQFSNQPTIGADPSVLLIEGAPLESLLKSGKAGIAVPAGHRISSTTFSIQAAAQDVELELKSTELKVRWIHTPSLSISELELSPGWFALPQSAVVEQVKIVLEKN